MFRDVSEGVVQKLMQLKQALDQGDFNQASSIQVSHSSCVNVASYSPLLLHGVAWCLEDVVL